MKNSKEIASTVFKARNEYMKQEQIKNRRIRKASAVCGTVCALCMTIAGVGYFNSMQTRLPSVTMDMEMESVSDAQMQEILPEEINKTEAQVTNIPTTDAAVVSSPAPVDTQAVQAHATDAPREENVPPMPTDTPGNTEEQSAQTDVPVNENTEELSGQTETSIPENEAPEEQTTETKEYYLEPQWDEKTISEQFVEFTANDTVYVSRCAKISNDNVGEKLYDVVVSGYDTYADEVHYADVSIYRINGVSTDCAVSVRFQGYDTGYVYTSHSYFPKTLGDMMDAMNLSETISFHTLYPVQDDVGIIDYDRSLLTDLLAEHRDCARVEDDIYHKPLFSISTNVDLLGITNKSLKVTEDGYLITNIMEWGHAFYIGKERAAALAQALGIEKTDTAVVDKTDASIQTTPAKEEIVYE